MLKKLVIEQLEDKTYTTEFKPAEEQSSPLLDGVYPDTEWASELAFATESLIMFVSDRPLGDQVAVKLPPIPFARSTKNKTRFEIQDERGRRMLTSKEYPVTQQFLYNAELNKAIIDEQKPIYIGFSPLSTPAESAPAEADPQEVSETAPAESVPAAPTSQELSEATVIKSEPATAAPAAAAEVLPTEATPTESDRTENDLQGGSQGGSQGGPPATATENAQSDPAESDHDEDDEDARSDQDIAMEYLDYFLRQHISFYKGSKLTSEQVALAIEGAAPEYVRTDLIDRKQITLAVRECFNAGMEKSSARIDGRHQKYWRDFLIVLDRPRLPRKERQP